MAKVLVLGNGGREHAIVKKLAESPKVVEFHATPGNYGIQHTPKLNREGGQYMMYDLVVVGPEDRLAKGVADQCRQLNIHCFGPTEYCTQIESSKLFAKHVMEELKIPTAQYHEFPLSDEKTRDKFREEALASLSAWDGIPVIKKNGLCAGKGVYLPKTKSEAIKIIEELDTDFLLEERLYGQEVTVMAFTDGKTVRLMPPVRDYKRLLDGDKGPNTGSMGSYCPAFEILSREQLLGEVKDIIQKVVNYFKGGYIGVLYAGLMVTEQGIKVLEFNARFGDSECQVVLPQLKNDLFEVMMACCNQTLHEHTLQWADKHCLIVNAASKGYPGQYETGYPVLGNPDIYAGVNREKQTSGGRVLGCIGRALKLDDARQIAYAKLRKISFHGMQFRKDIGFTKRPKRVLVMGSTRGTDLEYLYHMITSGQLHAKIVCVVTNKQNSGILEKGVKHGSCTQVIGPRNKLEDILERYSFDLICLIGYMKIIPDGIVYKYRDRMINVHPSLLPAFAGGMDKNVHRAVLESGVKVTGCTVHRVTEVVDGGEILSQKVCEVKPNDTVDTLKHRVQLLEGEALAEVIAMFPYYEEKERKYSVDIEGGNQVVKEIRECIEATYNDRVVSPWGAFAGCLTMNDSRTVLVSSTDSVGSKILLAQKYGRLDTIGHDLVNHCINDILVMGAKPLFFLDYVASAKLNQQEMVTIIKSVAGACKKYGIPLLGGETAEIKDMYKPGAMDLVGMITGTVDDENLITGEQIKEGDLVFGFRSSGFHTNGYTLVNQYATEDDLDQVLTPHRCYLNELKHRLHRVTGLVHITGGGWFDNPKRVLPKNLAMEIKKDSWQVPEVFHWIQQRANISNHEMFKTFNMGIGMLVIVSPQNRNSFPDATLLGKIKKRNYYPVELV
jgi:phosphoribosylamine--glycine ligase/phosphoribosylglycinamide formyltransferase/phosphoribosylformylglycinamidine cyclo-ligase/phosphoribosylamine--glycine ligase/phosphoribosylformylglycinamidine cyclo-ligase